MVNFEGVGLISSLKKETKRNGAIKCVIIDNETKVIIKLPCSTPKNLLKINERVYFKGYMQEDGIINCNYIKRAYLEPSGFTFTSDNEEVYEFNSKGLYLKVGVKINNFDLNYKVFEFIAKAGDENVLKRIINIVKNKKISIKGILKNNVPYLTSLDEVKK
jgi:hypothetical protein